MSSPNDQPKINEPSDPDFDNSAARGQTTSPTPDQSPSMPTSTTKPYPTFATIPTMTPSTSIKNNPKHQTTQYTKTKPRTTPRSERDVGMLSVLYDGSALEHHYQNRNSKETLIWVKEVTSGLTDKFSAIRAETIDTEQLEAVYDLSMRICELERVVTQRGLGDAFMTYSQKGNVWLPDKNVFECYSTISLDKVRASVRYVKEYAEEHLVWGTTLSFALMENSCEPELRARINEELMGIPTMEQGGPTYFKLVIQAISSMSYAVSLSLTVKVTGMKIKDYEGEDVTKAVSFLRGALQRLRMCQQTPPNVIHLLLKVMQTSSNFRFNGFFATWYNTLEQTSVLKGLPLEQLVSEEAILSMASRQYLAHNEEGTWIISRRRPAAFTATGGGTQGAPKPSEPASATLPRSSTDPVPPYMIPPGPNDPHERTFKGRPEYWCKPCNRWRRHSTEEHERGDGKRTADQADQPSPSGTTAAKTSTANTVTINPKPTTSAPSTSPDPFPADPAPKPTGLVGILRRTGV